METKLSEGRGEWTAAVKPWGASLHVSIPKSYSDVMHIEKGSIVRITMVKVNGPEAAENTEEKEVKE